MRGMGQAAPAQLLMPAVMDHQHHHIVWHLNLALCVLYDARWCSWCQGERSMAIEDVGKASKYRGVYTHQGKWMAKITALGTKHYLGFFNEEDEAAYAFNTAARFILREWYVHI